MSTAPQTFGKYTLAERIAVGGMAEIYRAKTFGAAGFEKELVIKRILPQFSADDDFVRMFIDEARLAAKLQHANVVQIFDFDCAELTDGPSYYIAMELVEGKDVRHLLKEGIKRNLPLSIPMCLHIAIESLKGLHYAHSKSDGGRALDIVHRDVSPHNLLVSYSGEVKISDFGIAKAAARASSTSNGMVKGKLAYMSPEQVTGQKLDCRTDIYSLGIVLYEMLTRTRLFAGTTDAEVIMKVRDAVVPPLRQRNPMVPPDVELVVMRMLTHDVRQRYQTGAEAAKALSQTTGYSATEAGALGEYVAKLFPITPRRSAEAAEAPKMTQRGPGTPAQGPRSQPAALPAGGGKAALDAATMMADAPSEALIAAARAAEAAKVAPKPAAPSIMDQSTAILDAGSPQLAAVQAQIAAAVATRNAPPPGAAKPAASIMDQSTAILDTNSPQHQAIAAQIAAASRAPAPPAAKPAASIMDQSTAILDTNSPQHQAIAAQIAAASAAAPSSRGAPPPAAGPPPAARGAPPPAAPPPPGGESGNSTVMLDVSIPAAALAAAAQRPQSQQGARALAPLPTRKKQSTALRWVIGPGLMLLTAGGTYFLAGILLPARVVNAPPPKVVPVIGHIQLKTTPPGASVTLDGKPHPHFTPTTLDGNVGDTVHMVVSLSGYQSHEEDLVFAQEDHPLNLNLDEVDPRAAKKPVAVKEEKPEHHEHAVSKPSGKGAISIFVHPWAIVFVDGTRLRQTPIANYELSAGKHTFQLVNDGLGRTETVTVNIKSGGSDEIRKEWAK